MTIALGFPYTQGVIIAADSQFTAGAAKITGQKTGAYAASWGYVIASFAGNVSLAASAFQECERNKEHTKFKKSPMDGFGHFLLRHYRDHVLMNPRAKETDGYDYDLLLGIYILGCAGARLFRVSEGAVREIKSFECIGIGEEFGRGVIQISQRPEMDHAFAVTLCSYAISYAKERAQYCGGPSTFQILTHEGLTLPPEEIAELVERHYHVENVGNWFIQECQRFLLLHNSGDLPLFAELVKTLESRMIFIRSLWDERQKLRGVTTNSQLPKFDPSNLPPWPG